MSVCFTMLTTSDRPPLPTSRKHLEPTVSTFSETAGRAEHSHLSLSLSDLEYFNERERNDAQMRKEGLNKSFAGFDKGLDAARHTPREIYLGGLRAQHRNVLGEGETRDTPPLAPRRTRDHNARKLLQEFEKADRSFGDRWEELSHCSRQTERNAPLTMSQSEHCARTGTSRMAHQSVSKMYRRSLSNEDLGRKYNEFESTATATNPMDKVIAARSVPVLTRSQGEMDTNACRSERNWILNPDAAVTVPHRYTSPRKKSRGIIRGSGRVECDPSSVSSCSDRVSCYKPDPSTSNLDVGKPSKGNENSSHTVTGRNFKQSRDPPGILAKHLSFGFYPENMYPFPDRHEGPTWAPLFHMSHSSAERFSSLVDREMDLYEQCDYKPSEIPTLHVH